MALFWPAMFICLTSLAATQSTQVKDLVDQMQK